MLGTRWGMRHVPAFGCLLLLQLGLLAGPTQAAAPGPEAPSATRAYVCPLGGRQFEGPDIVAQSYAIHQLDLRGKAGVAPLPRCPGNGLVLYKLDFSTAEKAKLSRVLGDAVFQKELSGHSTHYQAALIMRAMGLGQDAVVRFLLAAVWDAQGVEGAPEPSYAGFRGLYLRRTVDALDAYLALHGARDPSAVKLDLLRAELQRQRGEFTDASRGLEALPSLSLLSQRFERRWLRRLKAEIAAKNRLPALLAANDGITTRIADAAIAWAGLLHDRAAVLLAAPTGEDAVPGIAAAEPPLPTASEGPLLRPSLP